MSKRASLTANLVAKKGEAAPASSHQESEQPKGYYKALTVKLDRDRYRSLKQVGLDLDKSSQEILIEALDAYLAKGG